MKTEKADTKEEEKEEEKKEEAKPEENAEETPPEENAEEKKTEDNVMLTAVQSLTESLQAFGQSISESIKDMKDGITESNESLKSEINSLANTTVSSKSTTEEENETGDTKKSVFEGTLFQLKK